MGIATLQLLAAVVMVAYLSTSRAEQDSPLPYTYPEVAVANTTSLFFGLMQSFGGTYDGSGSITGVQLALDTINEAQELLPGYTLRFVLRDSFCDHTIALQSLHRLLFEMPTKIAIMGSGCSPATEPTAEIDHYYNLTHISCVSSSILLSNRTRYRAYFQMLPSEADISAAVYGAIEFYGWRYIAIITRNLNIHTLTTETLGMKLRAAGVNYSETRFDDEDELETLYDNEELFDPDARIFLIATFDSFARDIICLAHRKGYRYPQYLFLTYAWYPPQWWERDGSTMFSCTAEERLQVLNYTLAFLHFPFVRFGDVDAPTDVDLTGSEYMEEVEGYVDEPPLNLIRTISGAGFCHDATWTLAYALNRTMTELLDNETLMEEAASLSLVNSSTFFLEDFTYENHIIQQIMFRHLTDTNFTGVTGEVKFQEGIRDVDDLRVLQIRRTSTDVYDWVKIATVTINDENATDVSFIYTAGVTNDTVFPGGIPYDGVPLVEVVTIHLALTIIISVIVALGLTFSVICIVFNIVFRGRKLIRLSSPNLNYIICIGAIILYLDMVLLVIPSTSQTVNSVLCNLTPWFTSIGYSLCYGTILVKMFRVYYIYSNPSPRKKNTKIIKDEALAFVVLCLVIVDLILLITYLGVEGSRGNLEAIRVSNAENERDVQGARRITTVYETHICKSQGRSIFLGILYGYKSLFQILSLFLAFATRRVKVKGLNDSKAVVAAVYVTSITFSVLLVSIYTVVEYINVFAAIFCVILFVGTTSILALLYIPKMVTLYQDPQGLTVFRTDPTRAAATAKASSDQTTIETLRKRIRELETIITEKPPRPESAASSQHLMPPPQREHRKRLSDASDISLEAAMGEEKERKTIWDGGYTQREKNGTNNNTTVL